jgi:hypothetical protein
VKQQDATREKGFREILPKTSAIEQQEDMLENPEQSATPSQAQNQPAQDQPAQNEPAQDQPAQNEPAQDQPAVGQQAVTEKKKQSKKLKEELDGIPPKKSAMEQLGDMWGIQNNGPLNHKHIMSQHKTSKHRIKQPRTNQHMTS